jgi:hypothetical protein
MNTLERALLWLAIAGSAVTMVWQEVRFRERLAIADERAGAQERRTENVMTELAEVKLTMEKRNEFLRAMLYAQGRGTENVEALAKQNRRILEAIVEVQADENGVFAMPRRVPKPAIQAAPPPKEE